MLAGVCAKAGREAANKVVISIAAKGRKPALMQNCFIDTASGGIAGIYFAGKMVMVGIPGIGV